MNKSQFLNLKKKKCLSWSHYHSNLRISIWNNSVETVLVSLPSIIQCNCKHGEMTASRGCFSYIWDNSWLL